MNQRILRIVRGQTAEVYRVRVLDDGCATLERFEDGVFGAPRTFRVEPEPAAAGGATEQDPKAQMNRALGHITGFLNGTVTVGERELLSPTSALSRNVRWFPGDIQMLRTSLPYARELFPSAQFHVTQLLRRVFGDVTFLALVVLGSTLWLRTDAPVTSRRTAIGLQVVSMVAIIGFDRYWEPMRLRLRRLRAATTSGGRGWRLVYLVPMVLASQLVVGTVSVAVNTLLGLANVIIHPLTLWQSWRQLAGGRALEWKASSVSAGQDVRGWPLEEFRTAYGPAVQVGWSATGFGVWLIALGAPIGLLGLNGVGLFLASFLTVVLYAWCSGLPETSDGAPRYRPSGRELAALVAAGALGCSVTVALIRTGFYPVPAFEGSLGVVVLFLSASALGALGFPAHYLIRRRAHAKRSAGGPRKLGPRRWPVAVGAAVLFTVLVTGATRMQQSWSWSSWSWSWSWSASAQQLAQRIGQSLRFLRIDERQWRMPEPERRLYEQIEQTRRRHAEVDPEPLLRSEDDQPILAQGTTALGPELHELRGIPAPRLPSVKDLAALSLPELHPLPPRERTFIFKPRRRIAAPPSDAARGVPTPVESGRRATEVAQRRAAAVTPRRLSPEELRAQEQFITGSHFPWIGWADLRRLGQADARGDSIPLVELARAYRWEIVQGLWDAVPAARRGAASDRVRFQRLRDGIEGVLAIGRDPTAREVETYLDEELALIDAWSRAYPHLPLGAMRESPFTTPSRFSQVTRLLLDKHLTRAALAAAWRLDYLDAHWNAQAPIDGDSVQQVFGERPRTEAWERFELDWDGNASLARRWAELETEQALATKIWQAAAPAGGAPPTPHQLRIIVQFLAKVFGTIISGRQGGPYSELAQLFALDGVDAQALQARDPVARLWAARVWTEAMAGRVAKTVYRASAEVSLPGTPADRALIQKIARERFPDDGGDPVLRRVFEWLVLVDSAETEAELAAGYDQFAGELADRGIAMQGLPRAPRLPESEVERDLIGLWRELPVRFSAIPARDDMVAELLCSMAYFSSRNGHDPRTPGEFVDDFSADLQQVNDRMGTALPPAVQALADHRLATTFGRVSRTEGGRRFFGWWMVAAQARALQNDLDRHGVRRHAQPGPLAESWAQILGTGNRRWPHLPWASPGFAEFYLETQALEGWSLDDLWAHFGSQLSQADGLMARHVVPARALEALVERRIEEKTGALVLDPNLRRANAVMALARVIEVARLNQVDGFDGNPALLAERLGALLERVSRDYPHLDWDGEGMLEWYLLVGLRQDWDVNQTVQRFAPEWALADSLAASGWLARLEATAARQGAGHTAEERALGDFIDVEASRLEMRTQLPLRSPRARAMNALMALSALVLAAGEEGQIPVESGQPWSQARVRQWAAALGPGKLGPATVAWTRALVGTWAELLRAMREEAPHFPWHRGAIVETNLLAMGGAAVDVRAVRAARRGAWRQASDLHGSGFTVPPAFAAMVLGDFKADLRRKLGAARGIPEDRVPEAEVLPEDASLVVLDAELILADLLAEIHAAQSGGDAVDPATVARRMVEVQTVGQQRFGFVPWRAKGFTAAFVVASYRKDFRANPWKYAELIDMPSVDRLLGELGRREAHGVGLPREVVDDVRSLMREQTGRAPSSDQVIAFQALRDGSSLLREFLPRVPRSLDNVIALARLRSAVRGLGSTYPELHMVRGEDQTPRAGFAERLAVLAMKLGLAAGQDPADPSFVASSIARVRQSFLDGMSRIHDPLRDSLTAEEVELYQETIREEARADNPARAARFGLSPDALSIPDVKADDLVADAALYETLYASEIGQDQTYLGDLFAIFAKLRRRPEAQRVYREGLDTIDRRFAAERKDLGEPGYESWCASAAHRLWWAARGDFLRTARGQTIAMARTLALVKRQAFSAETDAATRASFARFGSFDEYLGAFLDAFEEIPRVPELAAAIGELHGADPFLGDGMHFALALFKCHVVNRLYPDPRAAGQVLRGIAALLPGVTADYQRILGFSPRLESGVPLYDARMSFLRREVTGGGSAGNDAYRRLNVVQRGVQRWTDAYLLKHAYKVLFFHELDAEDPTRVPRELPLAADHLGARGLPDRLTGLVEVRVDQVLDRVLPRTRGDQTTTFLEETLPDVLAAATGSHDPSAWIGWLMEHGEIGLDGKPTGRNPYADELAGFEARLARYRARIGAGAAAGRQVRAEEQRVRDIGREYDSFQRQVGWLVESARGAARLTARARRDYREAIGLHALLPLALLLALGLLVRRLSAGMGRGFGPVRVLARAVLVWLPLGLAVAVPLGVALRPARAAELAPRLLEHARLLERDPNLGGHFRLRGAAAQLARLYPGAPPSAAPETDHAR